MKYLDFEKHIKKELEGSTETVQMDALLASLNLGKQPNRKGFAYWMILPFLFLALSVFAWKFMSPVDHSHGNTYLSEASTTTEKIDNEDLIYTNSSHNRSNNTVQTNETPNSSLNPIESANTSNPESKNTSIARNSSLTKNPEKSPALKTTISNVKPYASDDLSTSTTEGIDSEVAEDKMIEEGISSSHIPQVAASLSSNEANESKSSSVNSSKSSRSLLSITDLKKSIHALEEKEVDGSLFSRMKINCPSFDNVGWHMALIPEVGIFLPLKTLENSSLEESAAFTERLKSESTLEGIEIGLYGMLVRDNFPFYLKAGVSYSRISERMDLTYEYTKQDTTLGIISTTVSSNGDTITHIYGDIITETTFKGSNRQHYYIHLFDVPLAVGYSTYLGGLDIGIEGGVKVNFMTRATGNLLTSEKDYTNLSLNRMYKNRIGLSYFGGLMIGRNFGRFGDFYVAPRFTYYPNEFNNANNSVSQKYFAIGLNAGVVYKIN